MNQRHPEYFQGILQLRDFNKEVLDFVKEKTQRAREDIFISKEVKVRNGVDLYFSSNKFLRKIGKMLQDRFGGELKESEKLYSQDRQTSKRIYRMNVLFRPHKLKKGDIIKAKGEKYVVRFVGDKIQARQEKSGKRELLSFDEVEKIN